MRCHELLARPELHSLATEHVLLLRRQLEGGACAVEDAWIVRVESALARAARACEDVDGIELAYDAMAAVPCLRLRSGERVAIPTHAPPVERVDPSPPTAACPSFGFR